MGVVPEVPRVKSGGVRGTVEKVKRGFLGVLTVRAQRTGFWVNSSSIASQQSAVARTQLREREVRVCLGRVSSCLLILGA